MPRGNGTGPMGMGPQTGRAAGYCAGYGVPGFMNPAFGRGAVGYGAWGRGPGRRNRYYATGLTGWQRAATGWPAGRGFAPTYAPPYDRPGYAPVYGPAVDAPPYPLRYPAGLANVDREQELAMLRGQVEAMEQGLKATREQIAELESAAQSEGGQEPAGSEEPS